MILSAYESQRGILTVITARLGLKRQDVEMVPSLFTLFRDEMCDLVHLNLCDLASS